MEKNRRKELQELYKNRKVIGGVYRIINRENGRFMLQQTTNINAAHNAFEGFIKTDNCTHPRLIKDWKQYGKEAFAIEDLDTIEKKETQTNAEFDNDLQTLFEMWDEKLEAGNRY